MYAYDIIKDKELYLEHGYIFMGEGKEAAKIVDITSYNKWPTIFLQIISCDNENNVALTECRWTDKLENVVLS